MAGIGKTGTGKGHGFLPAVRERQRSEAAGSHCCTFVLFALKIGK